MVKKTIKEVDTEVVILKSEFNDLKRKYDDLSEKFVNLEKRHDKSNVVKAMFNFGECGEEFDTRKSLKEHKKVHNPKTGPRLLKKCDLCEKTFDNN